MRIKFRLGPFFLLSSCVIQTLMAQPEGFQLISGQATPPTRDAQGTLVIQSENRTILSWDQFSIGLNEHVRFVQNGHEAAVLNRVIGKEASSILGRLSSNEGVYLLNPNGVLIGPGARIETSGFIASTLDVLDADFLEGRELSFHGDSEAKIINEGTIRSEKGDIFLAAEQVQNSGHLQADQGSVYVTATGSILFKPKGTQHLYWEINSPSQKQGTILQHSGSIEAKGIESNGGNVYLVSTKGSSQITGSIHAKKNQHQGGVVQILGDEISLLDQAHIDVCAPQGEGVILVGGDVRGENLDIKNAANTRVDKKAILKADATEKGNGGKIVIWGDQATFYQGFISARGGDQGGDGGFVEVSGKHLHFLGLVDRRAPRGVAGTLLLDPYDVFISSSSTANESFDGTTYTPTATGANILNTDLSSNLDLGNVTVVTTGAGTEEGNIYVTAPLSWTGSGTLTLSAEGLIYVNQPISCTAGSGGIVMTAAGNATILNNPGIQIENPGSLSTVDGDILLNGTNSGGQVGVSLSGKLSASGLGSISVSGTVLNGSGSLNTGLRLNSSIGTLLQTNSGNITLSGNGGAAGSSSNVGVNLTLFFNDSPLILTSTGNVIFNHCLAGDATHLGYGVLMSSVQPSPIIQGGGTITFSNCEGSIGINVAPDTEIFSSSIANPSIQISGRAITGPVQGYGVIAQGRIRATGAGAGISITGDASSSSNGIGISVESSGSSISTGISSSTPGGSIVLNGTASQAGNSSNSYGIYLASTANLSVLGGGTSSITLTGTGGAEGGGATCHGIFLQDSTVTISTTDSSGTGNIDLNGSIGPGSTANGINNSGASITTNGDVNLNTSGGSGSINIVANNPTWAAGGSFTVGPNASSILLGGTGTSNQGPLIARGGSSASLTFDCPVILSTATTFNSSSTNTPIHFQNTIDGSSAGSESLSLNAGTADILFSNNIGNTTRLGAISILASSGITFGSSATSILSNSLSVATGIQTTISALNTMFDTSANNGGIQFGGSIQGSTIGRGFTLNSGTGVIELSNGAGNLVALGDMVLNTSNNTLNNGLRLGGTFTATSFDASGATDRITLIQNTVIQTNDSLVGIRFGSSVNSLSANLFSLEANVQGGASAIFSGNIGSATPLSTLSLNATSPGNIQLQGTIASDQTIQIHSPSTMLNADTQISAGGTISLLTGMGGNHSLTVTSGSLIELGGIMNLDGSISMNSPVALSQNTALIGSTISLASTINSPSVLNGLNLTANNGPITFGGLVGNNDPLDFVNISNATQVNVPSTMSFNVSSFLISIGIPLVLGSNSLSITANSSSISLGGAIDGASDGMGDLLLNAAVNLSLSGNIGSTTRIGAFSATTGSGGLFFNEDCIAITATSFSTGSSTPSYISATNPFTIDTSLAGGDIYFGGPLDVLSPGGQSIIVTAGTGQITFAQEVGASGDLGSLAISTSNSILNGGFRIGGNIQASSLDASSVTGVTTILAGTCAINTTAAGGVHFGSPIQPLNPGTSLTLAAGAGPIQLDGGVGTVSPFESVTLSTTNNTAGLGLRIGSDISAEVFNAAGVTRTTLGNSSTITTTSPGTGIQFGGIIEAASLGVQGLTLSAGGGAVVLSSSIGTTNRLNFLSVESSHITPGILIGGNLSTVNNLVLSGASVINQNTTLLASAIGGIIHLTGSLNGAHNLTLTGGSATGIATLEAAMGPSLTNVTVSASSIELGANITTNGGAITFNNPVNLTGNCALNTGATGSIVLASNLNGSANFSANTQTLNFGGSVGDITPLSSLAVNASSITTHGDHSVLTGPMTYNGPVTITQSTVFANTGNTPVTFQDSTWLNVTGGISGNFPLSISSNGSIVVDGSINTTAPNLPGGSVNLLATNNISTQSITTEGGTNSEGGDVQITSTAGSIRVGSINANGGTGTGQGGLIFLQPSGNFTSGPLGNIPSGTIVLNGDLTAHGNGVGSIVLSGNRPEAMSVATITSSFSGNSVSIITPAFTVGPNEAITILGDFVLDSNTAIVGDIVSLGNLLFNPASSVTLLTHGDISLLDFAGELYNSPTAHFLSGGTLIVPPTITPPGPINVGHIDHLTRAILVYNPDSLVLNFDGIVLPPPSPPSPFSSTNPALINSFVIANSQLFYLLDQERSNRAHRSTKICTEELCTPSFPWFPSWLPKNDVW